MARGGSRPGAGRPKGTGGRPARKTSERIAITREAIGEGMTPLEYMLNVMRTSGDTKRRDAMAVAAAAYVHPRLAAVEAKVEISQHEEAVRSLQAAVTLTTEANERPN